MDKIEKTTAYFEKGFNCAQALLGAYGPELGLKRATAFKVACGFGGGIARMGETCGAVAGALMIIGLKHGMVRTDDKKAKSKTYKLCEKFVKKFRSRNNSVVCRDLLGVDITTYEDQKGLTSIIKDKCPRYVKDAAEIIEGIL